MPLVQLALKPITTPHPPARRSPCRAARRCRWPRAPPGTTRPTLRALPRIRTWLSRCRCRRIWVRRPRAARRFRPTCRRRAAESPRPISIIRRCPAILGRATPPIQTMPRSPILASIRRPPGRSSDRSIPIRKCRWAGVRSRSNGTTAGGCSTSTTVAARRTSRRRRVGFSPRVRPLCSSRGLKPTPRKTSQFLGPLPDLFRQRSIALSSAS